MQDRLTQNLENDDFGFKWSLSALCSHLENIGIDMNLLWSRIYDLIIKSIISGENTIINSIKKNCANRTNCFELFGFDILIDSDIKPWLVEINLTPSLACESPLDFKLKSILISDVLNLIGIKRFDRRKESINKMKNRMKPQSRGKSYNASRSTLKSLKGNPLFTVTNQMNGQSIAADFYHHNASMRVLTELNSYLDLKEASQNERQNMTSLVLLKHKDILIETMAEGLRKGNFVRIYPAKNSDIYDAFFVQNKPLNKFVYKCLYPEEEKSLNYTVNFSVPSYENIKKNIIITEGNIREEIQEDEKIETQEELVEQKVQITGDDVLIEYVERLIQHLKGKREIKREYKDQIEQFLIHRVWQNQSQNDSRYWYRLDQRLQEMKERRKRLQKSIYKQEGRLNEFETGFQQTTKQKQLLIKEFNSFKLEEMLRTSTKNVAQEVVASFINPGLLSQLQSQVDEDIEENHIYLAKRQTKKSGYINSQKGIKSNNFFSKTGNSSLLTSAQGSQKELKQFTHLSMPEKAANIYAAHRYEQRPNSLLGRKEIERGNSRQITRFPNNTKSETRQQQLNIGNNMKLTENNSLQSLADFVHQDPQNSYILKLMEGQRTPQQRQIGLIVQGNGHLKRDMSKQLANERFVSSSKC